jgi:7,8-dihydro-6-hydroxymethylpterin-pyrophosphokinase
VPHPRLLERRFALEPLLEVAPAARLPDGRALRAICDALPPQGVRCLWRPLAGLATMPGTGAGSESAS